jgi:flagellar motor component MotA
VWENSEIQQKDNTMLYTLENRNLFHCKIEDRASCYDTIEIVNEYATLARKEGLLSFEHRSYGLEPYQMKVVQYMVDGLDWKSIREFCEPEIVSSGKTGAELLKMVIFLEGMLSILQGTHPRVIRSQLEHYIGIEAIEYRIANLPPLEIAEDIME